MHATEYLHLVLVDVGWREREGEGERRDPPIALLGNRSVSLRRTSITIICHSNIPSQHRTRPP